MLKVYSTRIIQNKYNNNNIKTQTFCAQRKEVSDAEYFNTLREYSEGFSKDRQKWAKVYAAIYNAEQSFKKGAKRPLLNEFLKALGYRL